LLTNPAIASTRSSCENPAILRASFNRFENSSFISEFLTVDFKLFSIVFTLGSSGTAIAGTKQYGFVYPLPVSTTLYKSIPANRVVA
jgi:hypothetical protein